MQGDEFEADLRLLKLGGCDIVLEVDGMKNVSPISFDFNKMEVTFEKGGKKMTLTSNLETSACKMITGITKDAQEQAVPSGTVVLYLGHGVFRGE